VKRTYTFAIQVTTTDAARAKQIRRVFLTAGGEIPAPDGVRVTEHASDGITTRLLMERAAGAIEGDVSVYRHRGDGEPL
jgi:hypothetical protein